MGNANKPFHHAVAALNSLLTQVSAITLKDADPGCPVLLGEAARREVDFLAHVEVLGRSRTLACQVNSGGGAQQIRSALERLRSQIAIMPGNVTPVLIVPVLSPEVQRLCEEYSTGCLDLRGNGRLVIDEVFVSMRSLPRRVLRQPVSSPDQPSRRSTIVEPAAETVAQSLLRGFPASRAVSRSILHTGTRVGAR